MRAGLMAALPALVLALPAAAAPVVIDFTTLPSGASIEGPGAVDARLSLDAARGRGVRIVTGQNMPNTLLNGSPSQSVYASQGSYFPAPSDPLAGNTTVIHGGVGPKGGFGDFLALGSANRNSGFSDWVVSFADGIGARSFAITMLDFGDNNPSRATAGSVTWTGYDRSGAVVATDMLSLTIDTTSPRVVYNYSAGTFTSDGVTTAFNPQRDSDASAPAGRPGNFTFTLDGNGRLMTRVAVAFTSNGATWTDGGTTITADNSQPLDPKHGWTALTVDFAPLPVPEPMTAALLGFGALALAGLRQRRPA